MKAFVAVLVLGILYGAEARWELRWHFGRNLLQVTPLATQPAATTAPVATRPVATTPQTVQPAAATGLAAPGAVPTGAAVQPAVAQPTIAVAQPAAEPDAAAAAAANPEAPPASPQLKEYQGRQGVYVIQDPAAAPKVPATAAAANVTDATAANATAGPPAIAAGNNLMVVFTVMGDDAKTIYKNQQELRRQVATAAGVSPSQVLFYNQTANQDPRTGYTALSLSMAIDCGGEAACARAGNTLQNTTSQTKLSDSLSREGISVATGTFQVYGVNSLGWYKGNDTLYEDKNLLAPKTTALSYNQTMARIANDSGALPGALPGMPLGNFTIPGFDVNNTATAGAQPGFNLSTFQVPTQGLLPAGAVPLGNGTQAQQPVAPVQVKSSVSGVAAGAFSLLAAAAAAAMLV